jgi:hypothetical protein
VHVLFRLGMTYSTKGRRTRNPKKRELLISPRQRDGEWQQRELTELPADFIRGPVMVDWPRLGNVCDPVWKS